MRVMSRPCVSRPWCSTCRLVGKAEGASKQAMIFCSSLMGQRHFACGGGRPSKLKDASKGGAQPPQHEQLTSRGGCSTPPARTIDF